jgi:hypothetical protein
MGNKLMGNKLFVKFAAMWWLFAVKLPEICSKPRKPVQSDQFSYFFEAILQNYALVG